MQNLTLGLEKWVQCLVARNRLVRTSDRAEAAGILLIIAFALMVAPFAGAVGTATHDSLTHQSAIDRGERQVVPATVTADSTFAAPTSRDQFITPVRWQFANTERTDLVRSDYMKAGQRMDIWVDRKGGHTAPPLTEEAAAAEAIATGFGLWFAAVGVFATAWIVLRMRLNRLRYAAWDRALRDLVDNDGRTNRNV